MKKKYQISEEEFEAIKKAIIDSINLWNYDFIEAKNGDGSAESMSKEIFFDNLRRQFIIN